jgi:alpha-glucoside transport system substrate-binding protein
MKPFRTGALLALLLLLTPAAAACADDGAGDGEVLVVLGPWLPQKANDEADVFTRVIEKYEKDLGADIDYQGTRAIGQALRAKVRDGTPPDIAILPTVGELVGFANEDLARPVTTVVGRPSPALGYEVVVDHGALWRGDQAYAAAIKTDLKSLLIFPSTSDIVPPATLADMTAIDRGQWCLGLGEASSPGWPGTDWVEDLLLHQPGGRDAYQQWASGQLAWTSPQVKKAFQDFRAHYVADRETALLTSPQAAADNLGHGCTAMHQSSYYAQHGERMFEFPGSEKGVEVSADFAARFTTNPAADKLLEMLTDENSALVRDWAEESHDLVYPIRPNPSAYDGYRSNVAGFLNLAAARCMDASDAMPPTMAAAFQNSILEYVADPEHLPDILARLQDVQNNVPLDERLRVHCSREEIRGQ